MKMLFQALLFGLIPLALTVADIPPPRPRGTPVEMVVTKDSTGAGGAVLVIPAKLLSGAPKIAFLDLRADPLPRDRNARELVIGGMLLSLAITFGGRWWWKRRKSGSKGPGAGLAIAIAVLGMSGVLIHDALAQDSDDKPLNDLVAEGEARKGTVTLQISEEATRVELHLQPPRRPRRPRR